MLKLLTASASSLLSFLFLITFSILLTLSACDNKSKTDLSKSELLIYCGITMVYPIREIADSFEEQHNVKIIISQGGSEELYQNLKTSKKGDLYLPGSDSYRTRHMVDGLLGHDVELGFNQAAMMVAKNNPKNVKSNLNELLRSDLYVVIASPELGSIGLETEKILRNKGIYDNVLKNTAFQSVDSRTLNRALKTGDADVIINWKATAYFKNNIDFIDAISIDPERAKLKRLTLNFLKFSQHPQLADKFMTYAHSPYGLSIFKKYGFISPNDIN